jgi:2-iminobutanoate/2-iminopropanoate deaminase
MIAHGPRPVAPFSHAVEADGWVILTGQMPTDPEAPDAPLPEGVEAQTVRVMENLRLILEGVGLDLSHVVQMRAYLTEFERDYAAFNETYQGFFPEDRRPARTTVGVTALAVGALVEIDCIARRPGVGMADHVPTQPPFADGMAGAAGGAGLAGLAWWRSCCPRWRTRSARWRGAYAALGAGGGAVRYRSAETQPFTSVDWLVVRMVVPELPGPVWKARMPITTGSVAKSRFRRLETVDPLARADRRATDGGAVHPGRARAGDNSVDRGLQLRDGVCIWELL